MMIKKDGWVSGFSRLFSGVCFINQTLKAINQLPVDKAEEISDFADFVTKRFEEQKLSEGIQQLVSDSKAFEFLNEEEELYTKTDLKEVYNGQG